MNCPRIRPRICPVNRLMLRPLLRGVLPVADSSVVRASGLLLPTACFESLSARIPLSALDPSGRIIFPPGFAAISPNFYMVAVAPYKSARSEGDLAVGGVQHVGWNSES
jgi:hypothetical protein